MRYFFYLSVLVSTVCSNYVVAQTDKAGSKDHPLLSRYPGSHIVSYSNNYDEVDFLTSLENGVEKREPIEGDVTKIQYFHNSAESQPSPLQLIRNYQNAIKGIGGEVVAERKPTDMDGGETTLKITQNSKEYWIKIVPGIFSAPTQSYDVSVLERAAMLQVVAANKLLDELNNKGFVTLYINFETNKWDIRPESQPILSEVVSVLKQSPNMKISINGHTDNVGDPEANKALSENRAKSVLSALISQGVNPDNLSAAGFGQEKPIADNHSEIGRAKNRRVELVKVS